MGYRVRSPRGVQFRRWASTILKEYLLKGFVMDDEREPFLCGRFLMFRFQRSISKTLVGLVALAHVGCSTSIAANYPHLDRRSVCRLVPGTP